MKQQGGSSILKSLAVAFGDGLAFGVGVKLAQNSAKRRLSDTAAELPQAAPAPSPAPVQAEPQQPIDLQVLSKVLAAIDARLVQSETKIAADLKAVETRQVQQNSNSQAALEEIHESMMDRVSAVERSAQTVEARLAGVIQAAVEAHMREYIDARSHAMEERLRVDITAAGDRTAKLLVETIDSRLLGRIELLEGEVKRQAETIVTLRASADGSQKKLHEALEGIGRACQEAMQELKKEEPESSVEGGSGPAASEETPPAGEEDRRFDSLTLVNPARAERKLPIPLVSSLAVLLLGMAAFLQ